MSFSKNPLHCCTLYSTGSNVAIPVTHRHTTHNDSTCPECHTHLLGFFLNNLLYLSTLNHPFTLIALLELSFSGLRRERFSYNQSFSRTFFDWTWVNNNLCPNLTIVPSIFQIFKKIRTMVSFLTTELQSSMNLWTYTPSTSGTNTLSLWRWSPHWQGC